MTAVSDTDNGERLRLKSRRYEQAWFGASPLVCSQRKGRTAFANPLS